MNEELKFLSEQLDKLGYLFEHHKHIGTDRSIKLRQVSYGGRSDSAGTTATLPPSWTVSKSGGHVYTVTHNLNTTSYSVVANTTDVAGVTTFHPIIVIAANTFTVEFDTAVPAAGAVAWAFNLTLI